MSGDQPNIQIQTNGSNFSLSLLEQLNRDEELLKYAEVVEGLGFILHQRVFYLLQV